MSLNSPSAAGAAGAAIAPFAIKDLIAESNSSTFAGAPVGNSARACGTMLKNCFVIVLSVCVVTVPGIEHRVANLQPQPSERRHLRRRRRHPRRRLRPQPRPLRRRRPPPRDRPPPPARSRRSHRQLLPRHRSPRLLQRLTPVRPHPDRRAPPRARTRRPPPSPSASSPRRRPAPRARPRPSPRASPPSPSSAAVSARSTSRSIPTGSRAMVFALASAVARSLAPSRAARARPSRRPRRGRRVDRALRASRPRRRRVPRPAPSCARRSPVRTPVHGWCWPEITLARVFRVYPSFASHRGASRTPCMLDGRETEKRLGSKTRKKRNPVPKRAVSFFHSRIARRLNRRVRP